MGTILEKIHFVDCRCLWETDCEDANWVKVTQNIQLHFKHKVYLQIANGDSLQIGSVAENKMNKKLQTNDKAYRT